MKEWEISFGFYPGILFGFRTYNEVDRSNHVLYIQAAREELQDLSEEALIDRHRERKYEAPVSFYNLASDYDDEEED